MKKEDFMMAVTIYRSESILFSVSIFLVYAFLHAKCLGVQVHDVLYVIYIHCHERNMRSLIPHIL